MTNLITTDLNDGATFRRVLYLLRVEKGMTLREVAERSGISLARLWRFERGKTANPSIEQITRLCSVYGLHIDLVKDAGHES